MEKLKKMRELRDSIYTCDMCDLRKSRINPVIGKGTTYSSDILFVGEAPGRTENETAIPFSGISGKILHHELKANDLSSYYLANAVKCHPPNNRTPKESEVVTCLPYLKQQVEILNPKCICCLGRIAAFAILKLYQGEEDIPTISKLREKSDSILLDNGEEIKVYFTYHPSALLHNKKYEDGFKRDISKLKDIYENL